ncbi:MAG: NERD domain-containing protein [Proteobacteria bacterium]|nr:NERD domain-containing protein [Pseudomonadota bacterium]
MAIIFPDVNRISVVFASSAEETVYQLSVGLPDPWRVYYSCTLSMKESDSGIKEGEIDFVFYHPSYGVIVVEVKGGRISLDGATGQFYSVNRNGRSFAIRNPFQQAIQFRNRFVRFLRGHDINVPVSHAVCFPQVDENEFPPHVNIEPATLLGRVRLQNLAESLEKIVKSFHSSDFLKFQDVSNRLDDLLVGSTFKSRPLLREYMDEQEAKVTEMDQMHESLVSPFTAVQRLGVEGEAGTGKTLLATSLATTFINEGKKVLMLVASPLLASHIRGTVNDGIEVSTFQELAGSYGVNLLVAPSDAVKAGDDWIQYEAPERLRQAIEKKSGRYDVLLIDEAQDVQPFWWVALEALLLNRETSKLYVFFDRDQGVFGGGEGAHEFRPEDVLPVPTNYVVLSKNYRNTSEIVQFARPFKRGQNRMAVSDRPGYQPNLLTYKNTEEALSQLNHLVHRLHFDHGISENEIVILSARAPESRESILAGQDKIGGLKMVRVTPDAVRNGRLANDGEIGVATIASFKGLESKIVIVVNLSEHKMGVENPIMSSLVYVAFTRAKHMLYVFSRDDDEKNRLFADAAKSIKAGGSIVLDSAERIGEYTGKVVHFNPSRLTVIEMTTGEEVGKNVLLLAQDLERSGIQVLKKDQEIKFRIKNEGGVATAVSVGNIEEL